MFIHHTSQPHRALLPGVGIKTLVYGEKTLLAEFRLAAGSVIPPHAHPYEQTGYLISGRMRFRIGAEVFEAGPGDAWNIPLNVEHQVDVLEESFLVEVFSPTRADYLPENLEKR